MTSRNRQLIPQLLADPRLERFQADLSASCLKCLTEQGLMLVQPTAPTVVDTGVGAMRKLSTHLLEPDTGAAMQLIVSLLAKVDGSVHCWSELWGTAAAADSSEAFARSSRDSGTGAPVQPTRIRLTRQNYFAGHVSPNWVETADPVNTACGQLQALGLFETRLLTASNQLALAAVLAP